MADSFNLTARGFLTNSDGQILLCQNVLRGYYTLPGGHVDSGESAANAVVRELFEEFGLECFVKSFICVFEQAYQRIGRDDQKKMVQDYTLLFELWPKGPSLKLLPIQKEPHIRPVFVRQEELANIDFHPKLIVPILKEWQKNRINSEPWSGYYDSISISK
jgi:8-oxo-dGTP diphosphatase